MPGKRATTGNEEREAELVTREVYAALVASLRAEGLMPPSHGRVVRMFADLVGSPMAGHPEVCTVSCSVGLFLRTSPPAGVLCELVHPSPLLCSCLSSRACLACRSQR